MITRLCRPYRRGRIPIAAGEQEYTKWQFRDLILNANIDILQPNVTKCGGITGFKKIAALAETFSKPITVHNTQPTIGTVAHLHLWASTPNCVYPQEYNIESYPLRRVPDPRGGAEGRKRTDCRPRGAWARRDARREHGGAAHDLLCKDWSGGLGGREFVRSRAWPSRPVTISPVASRGREFIDGARPVIPRTPRNGAARKANGRVQHLPSARGQATSGVQSLERAFELLELLAAAEGSSGLSELASASGLVAETTFARLVGTLVRLGYVGRAPVGATCSVRASSDSGTAPREGSGPGQPPTSPSSSS